MSEGRAGDGLGLEPPDGSSRADDPASAQPPATADHSPEAAGHPEGPGAEQLGTAGSLEPEMPGLGGEPCREPPADSSGAGGPGTPSRPRRAPTTGHRPAVEPAAVLVAVERVGADVVALGRALAAQPEEVAARIDIDAATASTGVRIGALGSALDQLRLSLLAALDRAAEHADAPAWMPDLQATLAELAPRLDAPPWLADLQTSVSDLAARLESPPWLPALQATVGDLQPLVADQQRALRDAVTQLAVLELSLATAPGNEPVLNAIAKLPGGDRLQELTSAVERVGDDGRDLAERLVRVERAIAELSDGVRAGAAVADVLDHMGQRLVSIEDAAGRVAADARALVEQVAPVPHRLSAIAAQVDRITPLARAGDQAATLFDDLDRVAARLDEVTTLLRARAHSSQDAGADDDQDLDERLEAVVDVLAGVTRRQDQVTEAADAVLERMAQQERSVSSHLDWVGERLAEVAAHLVPDEAAVDHELDRLAGISEVLANVARRQDELAAAVATLLDRQRETDFLAEQIALVARRQEELAAALASSFDEVRDRAGPDRDAAVSLAASVEAITAVTEELAGLVESSCERLDRRLSWVEQDLADAQRAAPTAPATAPGAPSLSADAAALRLAELRAQRAEVQARLQEERLLAAEIWDDDR